MSPEPGDASHGRSGPREVPGVEALRPADGPLFAVVGVFDGIHRGHRYLLDHLVAEARRREAHSTVITFDSHPDELIAGAAPPLLVDPTERVRLLEEDGVELVVVQHFDAALRSTEYDEFIARITSRTRLAGLLMTPDAAFGHDRRGTVDALRLLGSREGFEVVVVPPFTIDGRRVSSSEVRQRVAAGDLADAELLLGRPYEVIGIARAPGDTLGFPLPVALPPTGSYEVTVGRGAAASPDVAAVEPGVLRLTTHRATRTGQAIRVAFGPSPRSHRPG